MVRELMRAIARGGWKEHGRTDRNLKNNCQVNEGIMKIIKYA